MMFQPSIESDMKTEKLVVISYSLGIAIALVAAVLF